MSTTPPGPGAHLDEATWERLALGELDAAARAAATAHITACPRCARVWKGLAALEAGAREFDPGVPAPVGAPAAAADRRGRRRWLVIGATLAAAAALALWVSGRPGRGPTPGDGAGDGDGVVRGAAGARVELVAPRGAGPAPARLDWRAVAGAERYVVEIFTTEGRRVHGAEVAAPGAPAPALTAGTSYRWRVEAWRGETLLATSALVGFTVAP